MSSDTREISIRRHCMQQLLHDAISCLSTEQDYCQGLLAGGGNMIKKNLAVTQNSFSGSHSGVNFFSRAPDNDAIFGIYFSANGANPVSPERIQGLIDLVLEGYGHPPDCYLLLELGHKGRVDARLFSDAALTVTMPLNMQEDGDPALNHVQAQQCGVT